MALRLRRRKLAQSFGPVITAITPIILLKASVGCIKMALGARVSHLQKYGWDENGSTGEGNHNNEKLFSIPFESRLETLPMILKYTTVTA
jgi:hypothetical protein